MDVRDAITRLLPAHGGAFLSVGLAAAFAGACAAHAAPDNEIGVTAAVRPNVHGTPPDQETRILAIGTDLYAQENVVTSKQGQTHLLFVDGSTLSMGPGAELTLDRFVYDPKRKTGEIVVSASKGLLRFVGGRISKTRPVLIKTPTSVIGIRGGIALIQIGDADTPASVTMLYGQEAFMERNGLRQTIKRPGFRIVESQDGGIEQPKPATQAEMTRDLQTLEEPPPVEQEEENLGDIAPAAGGDIVQDEDIAETQMAELGSDNDPEGPSVVNSSENATGTTESEATTESTMAQQQVAIVAQQPVGATTDNDASANRVNESAADFTPIGIRAHAADVNASDRITYGLTNNAGGRFAIDPQTGVIRVANSALLDAETAQSHSVTVKATSSDGSFTTATFIITIEDDNSEFAASTPVDSNATANLVNESAANGSAVGVTANGPDMDVSDAVTYSLDDSAGGRFTIDASTGVISVADSVLLDAESTLNHTVTVRSTSADGSSSTATFAIAVSDDRTEHSVTTPTITNGAILHGAATGSQINVTASADDSDISDTGNVTFSLVDDAGARFQINPTTGRVAAGATATDFKNARRHTITVRAMSPDGSTADANSTIEVRYFGFEGRLKRDANGSIEGTDDADPNNNFALTTVGLVASSFAASPLPPGTTGLLFILPFPDAAGPFTFDSGDDPPLGSLYGTGNGVLNSEQTFVYYEVTDAASARSLVFAGDPATAFPSTGITAFDLSSDFVRDQDLPFVNGFPIGGLASHGKVFVAWDDSAPGSQQALGGGIVYVTGSGSSQKSGAFFVTGQVLADPSATRHGTASLFGMTRADASMQPTFYSGGLATSDTDTLDDFFGGGPDAFVLESATVNALDAVQSRGLERSFEEVASSFNANSVALRDGSASFTAPRTSQTLNGFAAGNQQLINGSSTIGVGYVTGLNGDADNVSITTDAALNTVDINFTLEDFNQRTIVYSFGSSVADGTGAFIEDGRFYARSNSATVDGLSVTSQQGLATSDNAVFDGGGVPAGFDLCDCDYLTWGFWGAMRQFTNASPNTILTHLGSWVAGELASIAEVTSSNVASAVYSGNVLADVRNNANRYVTTGSIDLTFDFSPGSFTLEDVTVSNLDGLNFTSTGGGGTNFTSNRYTSTEAELSITSGTNTITLEGAFFAGQAAPNAPLATAGQGIMLSGSPQHFLTFTYGAALQP